MNAQLVPPLNLVSKTGSNGLLEIASNGKCSCEVWSKQITLIQMHVIRELSWFQIMAFSDISSSSCLQINYYKKSRKFPSQINPLY